MPSQSIALYYLCGAAGGFWRRSSWSHWIHSYGSLFADALFSAFLLIVFTGLWFFRRWARWAAVLLFAPAIVYSVARPSHSAVSASTLFLISLNAAIIAGPFLPPLRDRFTKQDLTNR